MPPRCSMRKVTEGTLSGLGQCSEVSAQVSITTDLRLGRWCSMNLSLTVLGLEVQDQHAVRPASAEGNPLASEGDSHSVLTQLLDWSLFLHHQFSGSGSTLMISFNLSYSFGAHLQIQPHREPELPCKRFQ